jgi:hypothetical protein
MQQIGASGFGSVLKKMARRAGFSTVLTYADLHFNGERSDRHYRPMLAREVRFRSQADSIAPEHQGEDLAR